MKAPYVRNVAWLAQAALIVLPVLGLSAVGLYFLREDKAAMQQEAQDRARSVSAETARRIGDAISARLAEESKDGHLLQGEIVSGQARALPDYPRIPAPSDWPQTLPPAQAQLWRTAQERVYRGDDPYAANQALTALSESVSGTARANAQLWLLEDAARRGPGAGLTRQAVTLAQRFPDEVTEAGAPIGALALLLALRHVTDGNPPEQLLSALERNLAEHPSFLSPALLEEAARIATGDPYRERVAALRAKWNRQELDRERTRELLRQLAGRPPAPLAVVHWQDGPDQLALCTPRPSGCLVTMIGREILGRIPRGDVPDYMGVYLAAGGISWSVFEHAQALSGNRGTAAAFLSGVPGSFSFGGGKYPFLLTFTLSRSDLLFASYDRRAVLTEWLVLFAAAAALLGLARLWHSFRTQARLTEMKSNLLSSVSHELRAPIAAVRLLAESLESGRVDGAAKQNEYHRLIVRECRRLSALVENVLDFERIDQGRKQYHFEPLDPAALLRHTVLLMEPGAAERQVRITLSGPPPAFADLQPSWDGEAVEQSLVNLLDNAIKHSPAGAEVRVETETSAESVRFWVVDQGPGIPANEHERIFELFYRRCSELRRETEGVGIGLSIVKHVAEAHRGRVLVESAAGQGSRFGLELPR